jgi:hypothetical protein
MSVKQKPIVYNLILFSGVLSWSKCFDRAPGNKQIILINRVWSGDLGI